MKQELQADGLTVETGIGEIFRQQLCNHNCENGNGGHVRVSSQVNDTKMRFRLDVRKELGEGWALKRKSGILLGVMKANKR